MKNALLEGLRTEIRECIRKHNVGLALQNMEFMAYGSHAESVLMKKIKNRAGKKVEDTS